MADVGQTYACVTQFLDGKMPYRDFNYQWGPYALYTCAFFLKVFGVKISAVRLLMVLTVMAITTLTYALGRRLLSPLTAFLAAFIVHMSLMRNTLVPYANILVIPVGLAALLSVIGYLGTGRKSFVYIAGVLCGVAMGLKLSAGLFVTAGITMALFVVTGRPDRGHGNVKSKFGPTAFRLIVPLFLSANVLVLTWRHLTPKYFALFVAPVLIACLAGFIHHMRVGVPDVKEGQLGYPARALAKLFVGGLLGSLPWLAFYLFKLDAKDFSYNLVGSALEHSRHIFLAYPEMDILTAYLLAYTVSCVIILPVLRKKISAPLFALTMLLALGGYGWMLRDYMHLKRLFDLLGLIRNISSFLGPLVAVTASAIVIRDVIRKSDSGNDQRENVLVLILALYQVFFILVAYPHTEFTHLSWSFPTTMILFLFLFGRVQLFIRDSWPFPRGRICGRAITASLVYALPLLICIGEIVALIQPFFRFSPDLLKWSRKEYVLLDNERADIYEFVESAYQIESIDRFIQANTEEGDHIFEFPTTFFYYYSRRKNPSRWDYFYPGLYSGRQGEIIADIEKTKPAFVILYDNPHGWMFTYSNIKDTYAELAEYIEKHYEIERRLGYFRIMKRNYGRS
jgi:hypothetical protein